jgi:hypothetical protein
MNFLLWLLLPFMLIELVGSVFVVVLFAQHWWGCRR